MPDRWEERARTITRGMFNAGSASERAAVDCIARALREIAREEREACAKIADEHAIKHDGGEPEFMYGYVFAAEEIAGFIRQRGERDAT